MGENDYVFNLLGTLFKNRGIKDVERFLNPTEKDCHEFSLLDNIDEAVECLLKHVGNENKIHIIVDCDKDGFTSAAVMYMCIKEINPKAEISWNVQKGKQHGIILEDLEKFKFDLLIVPDAGTNQKLEHYKLSEKGIDVIILDHHLLEGSKGENNSVFIVNNQLDNYPNKALSGVGIVYKFCQALDNFLFSNNADKYLDLVAAGMIADSMSMKELENRYLIKKGLDNINNKFLKALISQQSFSLNGNVNITGISFYIAPLVNSVIRFGTMEDKEDMFESFINSDKQVIYKKRGGEEVLESIQQNMARRAYNLKSKQNRERDKLTEKIDAYIVQNNLHENKVIIISDVYYENKNLTGLICNSIAGKYKKPTIILNPTKEDKNVYGGSARGYDKGDLKDFKSIVLKSGVFNWSVGHNSAFGTNINKENIHKATIELNKLLKDYTFENSFEVDFEIDAGHLSKEIIFEIDSLKDIWGKQVEEPYIMIKDIPVEDCEINLMGKTQNTIGIEYNGIKYIMFKVNEEIYDDMNNSKYINIVGRASVNEYNGNRYPQIIIADYDLAID